jgi:competence protein ComFC
VRAYVEALLELIYPSRCPSCGQPAQAAVCLVCARLLPTINRPICLYCGKPTLAPVDRCNDCRGRRLHFTSARAAWIYDGPARPVIHAFKYGNRQSLGPKLADYLAPLVAEADLVTWVPLTRSKRWKRGYNQARILARALAARTKLPPVGLLVKTRSTLDQNRLDVESRLVNLRGAFKLKRPAPIEGRRVVLVDDVYTTGSTVSECALVLKMAGAASIQVATLARALGPNDMKADSL